jgi:hypothetical protein
MVQTESDFAADYEAHATAQDAAYQREYERWVATLSEQDRERLTLDGLLEPDTSHRISSGGGGGGEIDISLVPHGAGRADDGECVPTIGPPDHDGTPLDQLRELGLSAAKAEAVLQWIARRHDAEVNKLSADRLARFFAHLLPAQTSHKINLALLGVRALAAHYLMNRNGSATMTSLAQRANMSKQLLDHHVHRTADAMRFHGFGMKRESTRAIYAENARAQWAALTPEQRRQRRAGKAAQSSSNDQI